MSLNLQMRRYLQHYLSYYIFVSVLFIMGVIFGSLMVNALSMSQKQELTGYLGSFFQALDQGAEPGSGHSFIHAFGLHMKWMGLIWLLGLSVIGLPVILILDFLKGVLIGFTVGYMVGQLSWKGVLFALVSVAPQNLIVIPVLIICSVSAIAFSVHMIRSRFIERRGGVFQPLLQYTSITAVLCGILAVVSFFEAYVSPVLMKWATPFLIS